MSPFKTLPTHGRHGNLNESLNELFRRSQKRFHTSMKTLEELFPESVRVATTGDLKRVPSELTIDSRRVTEGSVFFAISGHKLDGHKYIPEAIARGARSIISQDALPELPVATIQVKDIRVAMAEAARRFWGMPEKKMTLVGLTGTKGKTTTAYLVRYLMDKQDADTGMLSTIEYNLGSRSLPAYRTTPDSLDTYSYLAQMVENGLKYAVMEASSHALDQGRMLGLPFEVALFTNLSSEHMDYHKTMDEYYAAKRQLFMGTSLPKPKRAIINLDDPWGQRLFSEIPEGEEILTFGSTAACDLQIVEQTSCYEGSHFTLKLGSRKYRGWLPMVGAHNLHNAVGALAVIYALGMNLKQAVADLENFPGVPGRLERIYEGQPFEVIVDYAHTDEALRQTLIALRPLYKGRIITVFGCGGNRDQLKRPRMTQVAMENSDYVFATSDNPRREQLEAIFAQMKAGVVAGKPIEWIADRRQAIAGALRIAQAGDCVLIAGKGHETYQEFADAIVPFDDRKVVREVLGNVMVRRD